MKKILILVLLVFLASPCLSADQWDKSLPAGSTLIQNYDSVIPANNEAMDRVLKNYQRGARLTYKNASTITVTSGEVVCSKSDGTIRKLRANASSTDVTFASIDTGTEDSSTTYYVYAVADTDIEGFTFLISESSSAPTGATYFKKLGSFVNNASSNITDISNLQEKNFGTISSKTQDVQYQALTDGFLFGNIYVPNGGSEPFFSIKIGYDISSPEIGMTIIIPEDPDNPHVEPFCYPVRKGQYYKITRTSSIGTVTMSFMPYE